MTRSFYPARPRSLLYVAFYFPPTRASGVYRALATANFFAAHGWDVTVITVGREFFFDVLRSYDESLESQVRDDVRVERVHFSPVHFSGAVWGPEIRKYNWLQAHFPTRNTKFRKWLKRRVFPEQYWPWIPGVVRRGLALHRRQPFDAILATGNPHASFVAAWLLSRLIRRPYAIDYRDSWTVDIFEGIPAFPPSHPAWRWERRVISKAARIVFVNQALRVWHAERYPESADRMMVVQNGYDPGFLGDGLQCDPAPHDRPLRFGYLGTITRKVPLQQFIEAWRLAREEPELGGAEALLYGYLGFVSSNIPDLYNKLSTVDSIGVRYRGPVSKAEVIRVYEELDVLLLILAGSRHVTSGKVYEYIATGKPIVSIHQPDSAANEILKGYPLWFPVRDLEAESVRDALLDAARAVRSLTPDQVAQCRQHAKRFSRGAQLRPLEVALREVVHG